MSLIRILTASFAILLLQTRSCLSEELLPYDRLARNNITLKAAIKSSGYKTTDQPVKTDYGTYVKNQTTAKEVQILLSLVPPDVTVTLEAYAVFKDYQTKEMRIERLPLEKSSADSYSFIMATEKTRERWMYADDGRVSETGEKILAWFVRAIVGNQIVGFAASAPTYDDLAQKPDRLEAFLAKNK